MALWPAPGVTRRQYLFSMLTVTLMAGTAGFSYWKLGEANDIAQQEMAEIIATDVRRDIGGDVQRIESIDTRYSEETFKHILLPIWTAAYKYSGKSYRFLVNGQTGEVQGERPYSWWKIGFALVAVAILVTGAIYLHDPSAFG